MSHSKERSAYDIIMSAVNTLLGSEFHIKNVGGAGMLPLGTYHWVYYISDLHGKTLPEQFVGHLIFTEGILTFHPCLARLSTKSRRWMIADPAFDIKDVADYILLSNSRLNKSWR